MNVFLVLFFLAGQLFELGYCEIRPEPVQRRREDCVVRAGGGTQTEKREREKWREVGNISFGSGKGVIWL